MWILGAVTRHIHDPDFSGRHKLTTSKNRVDNVSTTVVGSFTPFSSSTFLRPMSGAGILAAAPAAMALALPESVEGCSGASGASGACEVSGAGVIPGGGGSASAGSGMADEDVVVVEDLPQLLARVKSIVGGIAAPELKLSTGPVRASGLNDHDATLDSSPVPTRFALEALFQVFRALVGSHGIVSVEDHPTPTPIWDAFRSVGKMGDSPVFYVKLVGGIELQVLGNRVKLPPFGQVAPIAVAVKEVGKDEDQYRGYYIKVTPHKVQENVVRKCSVLVPNVNQTLPAPVALLLASLGSYYVSVTKCGGVVRLLSADVAATSVCEEELGQMAELWPRLLAAVEEESKPKPKPKAVRSAAGGVSKRVSGGGGGGGAGGARAARGGDGDAELQEAVARALRAEEEVAKLRKQLADHDGMAQAVADVVCPGNVGNAVSLLPIVSASANVLCRALGVDNLMGAMQKTREVQDACAARVREVETKFRDLEMHSATLVGYQCGKGKSGAGRIGTTTSFMQQRVVPSMDLSKLLAMGRGDDSEDEDEPVPAPVSKPVPAPASKKRALEPEAEAEPAAASASASKEASAGGRGGKRRA